MNTPNIAIVYNESENYIGYRPAHSSWEEGDDITTNGIPTTIFAIFRGTHDNLSLAKKMIDTLRAHEPKKKVVTVLKKQPVVTGDLLTDLLAVMEAPKERMVVDVRRKVWKDFDAKLDFVDEVVCMMED